MKELGKEGKEVILSKKISIVKVRTQKMINRGSGIKRLQKKVGLMKIVIGQSLETRSQQNSDLERGGGGLMVGRAVSSFLGPQGW